MGALGGMTGTAGGISGTGLKGPEQANIQAGTSARDVTNAQSGVNNSLASQNALLSALQGQNGLSQQNNVASQQQSLANQLAANNGASNQAAAMAGQAGLNNQLAAANGVGTQNAAIAGLQGAAGMYQNIANGTGPNPAQAMLNQSTGQNVANQAALMAGQRGAGSNVGLLARQAAQQGAATQQQAVGQGATMQANQQLNALTGLTGANATIGGLGTTQAGMQQTGISQQGALAGQQLSAQQAQQQALANQANTVAGQQIAGTNAAAQAQLVNQQQLQGALSNQNNANVSNQGNVNNSNTTLTGTSMQGQQKLIGGIANAAGPAAMALLAAGGGQVTRKMAEGGDTMAPAPALGPTSSFGQFLSSYNAPKETPIIESAPVALPPSDDKSSGGEGGAGAMAGLSTMMASSGGLAENGGHVKAKQASQKAVKGGNSYANDKIPAKLSEGEIVLPRTVTMSEDPVRDSAAFVQKVLAKRKMK